MPLPFTRRMQQRRTIRDFSDRPVPRKVIEQCIRSAGTAPNGANLQPWHFVAISNPDVKREIRVAAEIEERRILYKACPKRVAGGVSAAWHGFEQAVSGDGTVAHRDFRSTIPNPGGWHTKQDVLRD